MRWLLLLIEQSDPYDSLAAAVANDITATLSARGIPVHGPLHHKGPVARLHRQRDFIALVAIAGMEHVLVHDRHHVHRVAAVSHHLLQKV